MSPYEGLVDLEARTVSPRLFADADVYRAELERIFARSWLFVAHESQISRVGDFLTNTMGEESVVVCRDSRSRVRVFVNSCRHRGVPICRVEQGNAKSFTCPYHGWTYDIQGRLVGVPQLDTSYHGELNRDEWGLLEVPRVESYRGLIFACLEETVEPLDDYLGEIRWYLDSVFNRTEVGYVALPGTHRWVLDANWKFGAEQFGGDNYHANVAHAAMTRLGFGSNFQGANLKRSFEAKTKQGHGWINLEIRELESASEALQAYENKVRVEAAKRLEPAQTDLIGTSFVGTIFPNFSLISVLGFLNIRLWQPRGPGRMEVWSWDLIGKDAPADVVAFARDARIRTFSPSGIFEQDDGEVWTAAQRALGGPYRKRFALNYSMGAGHGFQSEDRPGTLHGPSTEIPVFGFYERWRQAMATHSL